LKVFIEGDINRFYVQNLCILFFPGAKFSESEEMTDETPIVRVKVSDTGTGIHCTASMAIGKRSRSGEHIEGYLENSKRNYTKNRAAKIAVGVAVIEAGEKFFGSRSPWGILTGVRPAKIATEMLQKCSDTKEARKELVNEYFINPKKASLILNIAQHEEKLIKTLPEKLCSLYISIPFCPSRCAYCSFVSYSTKKLLDLLTPYVARLKEDIKRTVDLISELGLSIATVYIGGGTPTILSEEQLEDLLSHVASLVAVDSLMEYTLEAGRPDTISEGKLAVAKKYGVTRISVNAQTMNNDILRGIGRNVSAEQFYKAYDIAKRSGIKYINTDLIAGLPGEGFSSFSDSVDKIIALEPDNITVHTFCVKNSSDIINTGIEIYSRTGGETAKSVEYSQLKCKNAGYIPYYIYRQKNSVGNLENVGFAKKGAEGLYNIFMMEEIHSIFACGAGAVTKLVASDRSKIMRMFMPKYPFEYLAADGESSLADQRRKALEFFCTEV